ADRPGSCADDPDRACPATCGSVVRTARRNADNAALCRQSSYDARAPRASFCEDESQCVTSCDSDPIPASKLLVSQNRSDRGACGFVLTRYPESAAKLAANPAGEEPASRTCPVATAVIPDGREGDLSYRGSGVN